jgi:TRAP-type C4-dicarboxylate transport system permease large subunit
MKDHGYSTEFAVGVTAASATLGPIIPPSLPFVIYGMMANVSVGALFLAGILPGVLMALLMMLTVAYFAHKNGWGGDVKFNGGKLAKALFETAVVVGWPLLLWVLIGKLGFPPQLTVAVALAEPLGVGEPLDEGDSDALTVCVEELDAEALGVPAGLRVPLQHRSGRSGCRTP